MARLSRLVEYEHGIPVNGHRSWSRGS